MGHGRRESLYVWITVASAALVEWVSHEQKTQYRDQARCSSAAIHIADGRGLLLLIIIITIDAHGNLTHVMSRPAQEDGRRGATDLVSGGTQVIILLLLLQLMLLIDGSRRRPRRMRSAQEK